MDEEKRFAKLFESEEFGQMLITLLNGDNGPEITYQISEFMGMQPKIIMDGYDDSKSGYDFARTVFDKVDQSVAEDQARGGTEYG